jgi:hypothetical protein
VLKPGGVFTCCFDESLDSAFELKEEIIDYFKEFGFSNVKIDLFAHIDEKIKLIK